MDYLNFSNLTNRSMQSDYYDCMNGDEEFVNLGQFLKCFRAFLLASSLKSLLVISFAVSTVVMNILVISYLNRFRKSKTVFDRIFIAHAVVDLLIGIFVIPFYLVYSLFGYWPLGKSLCLLYVSLDYTLCHVGILHMVFISFARLRSLQHPHSYKLEFFISNTKLTIVCLWLVSITIWIPAIYYIMNLNYRNRNCYFTFDPIYILFQDILAYLMPMLAILITTFYIMNHLRHTKSLVGQKHSKRSQATSAHNFLRPHGSIESQRLKLVSTNDEDTETRSNTNSNTKKAIHFDDVSCKNTRVLGVGNLFKLLRRFKINAHQKLCVILATFCALWLPFCILWPLNSICTECVPSFVYSISYWMGYAQSLINPVLLLILTKPVSDKKIDSHTHSVPSELK